MIIPTSNTITFTGMTPALHIQMQNVYLGDAFPHFNMVVNHKHLYKFEAYFKQIVKSLGLILLIKDTTSIAKSALFPWNWATVATR